MVKYGTANEHVGECRGRDIREIEAMRLPLIMRRSLNAAIAGAVLVGVTMLGRAIYYDNVVGPDLERRLGFSLDTPLIETGPAGAAREVAQFSHVSGDGVLGRAGFRRGDVLVDLHKFQFYALLARAVDGDVVDVKVLRGGDGDLLDLFREIDLRIVLER
jgi:hypothetical protein